MSIANNNSDGFDLFTLPSMVSCALATAAIIMITRMSYVMGTNYKDRGSKNYTSAYWTMCLAMILVSCAYSVVKVLE